MNWAEALLLEQDTANSKLTELLQMPYDEYRFIVAVEGRDDENFYHDFIEKKLGEDFLLFSCGNKSGVLNLREASLSYKWTRKPEFIFICDRDFDEYIGGLEDDIYYTDHYSLESMLTLATVLIYALRKEVMPRPRKSIITSISKEYELELARCAVHLKSMSCLMIECRARGIHPKFDEVNVIDQFDFADHGISPNVIDIDRLKVVLGVEREIIGDEYMRWEDQLDDEEFRKWIRGKHLLQLARKCAVVVVKRSFPSLANKCANYLSRSSLEKMGVILKDIPSLSFVIEETKKRSLAI